MAVGLWKKLKDDWERQPLAIILQASAIFIAIAIFTYGASPSSSVSGSATTQTGISSGAHQSIAILLLLTPVFAALCRPFFARTVIGGFFVSIVLAALCILVFSLSEKKALIHNSTISPDRFRGPLIDLVYWSTFLIFMATIAGPAIKRIIDTRGQRSDATEGDEGETAGVTPIELFILAAVWGSFLSGAQQRILGAFVFERTVVSQPTKVG